MKITSDFSGANIRVVEQRGDEIILENEQRGSGEDWFYWAFCVQGAAGRRLRFRFLQPNRVGYYGAAVSRDLRHWEWTGDRQDGSSFSYQLGEDDERLYFAHNMLYSPDMFYDFAQQNSIELTQLCRSERGNAVPLVQLGNSEARDTILLTARHHCCEATGSYVLQGVLEQLKSHPIEGYRVLCVPFVDLDGVLAGDQGKARLPHDHNRDYDRTQPSIYRSVAAIRQLCEQNRIVFGFDFHSPWHTGGVNDLVFIPKASVEKLGNINRFGELLEKNMTAAAMQYHHKNDIEPNVGWNRTDTPGFSRYILAMPTAQLGMTLETTYFGVGDSIFSPERAVETGRCFARAIAEYIRTM